MAADRVLAKALHAVRPADPLCCRRVYTGLFLRGFYTVYRASFLLGALH